MRSGIQVLNPVEVVRELARDQALLEVGRRVAIAELGRQSCEVKVLGVGVKRGHELECIKVHHLVAELGESLLQSGVGT